GMRHDAPGIRKGSREVVHARRVRMADARAHPARHPGAHARRSDVYHPPRLQLVDDLEQGVVAPVVDRKVLHDRVKMEPDHAQLLDGLARLAYRNVAFRRLNRAPRLYDALRVALPEP